MTEEALNTNEADTTGSVRVDAGVRQGFPPIPEGLDDGHVHEVVDRLHVVICTIEDHIESHPLVQAIPSIHGKIERATALLADAYQEAGAVGFIPPAA